MLAYSIDRALELMEKTKNQSKNINEYNNLNHFYLTIKNNEHKYTQIISSIEIILNYTSGLSLFEIKDGLKRILEKIKDIVVMFNKDELAIRKHDLKELLSLMDILDENIKENWQKYMREKNNEILNSLSLIENLIDDNISISQYKKDIKDISIIWPIGEKELNDYDEGLEKARFLIKDLDVSPKVQKFLLAVAGGNATLGNLDETVIEWLKRQGLEGKLKISYK